MNRIVRAKKQLLSIGVEARFWALSLYEHATSEIGASAIAR